MTFFDDLLRSDTLTSVRNTVIGYAQAAGLQVSTWIVGSVGQQMLEAFTATTYQYTQIVARITRGFASLDTSTDPGDEDAFDSGNVNLTPAPGFLSNLGENTFGTTRTEQTFATGFVTFTNAGPLARTFGPGALTFRRSTGAPPPTYRNAPDPTIYTNPDGTVTVAANASPIELPVIADAIGTDSNANQGTLSLVTSLVGCSATNDAAITATEREHADTYRLRCRQAPARLSFGAPADAIAYLAAKTLDGDPLTNEDGNPVNINRVQVTNDNATGVVEAYYASSSGPAIAEDVIAANANIELHAYAVMDAITFDGYAATGVTISVVGTASIKARAGLPDAADIAQEIVDALTSYFETFPLGGVDQTAGAGVIYTDDIEAIAANAYPGLYNVQVTTPAGASTALALGRVAVLDSVAGDWTVTVVP